MVHLAKVDPEARVKTGVETTRSDDVTVIRAVGAPGLPDLLGLLQETGSHPEGGLLEVETGERIDRDLGHIRLAAPQPFHKSPTSWLRTILQHPRWLSLHLLLCHQVWLSLPHHRSSTLVGFPSPHLHHRIGMESGRQPRQVYIFPPLPLRRHQSILLTFLRGLHISRDMTGVEEDMVDDVPLFCRPCRPTLS